MILVLFLVGSCVALVKIFVKKNDTKDDDDKDDEGYNKWWGIKENWEIQRKTTKYNLYHNLELIISSVGNHGLAQYSKVKAVGHELEKFWNIQPDCSQSFSHWTTEYLP